MSEPPLLPGFSGSNDRDYVTNLLEHISDAFFALSLDWEFTYINRKAEFLLQSPKPELLGKNIWEAFPEAVGSVFYQKYHQALAQQDTAYFEAYYAPFHSWFEVRVYPTQDGLLVYFNDITLQKQAQEAIQKIALNLAPALSKPAQAEQDLSSFNPRFNLAELELQAIIARNMAEGVCLVKVSDAQIVYANPKFERMFGYDVGELAGKSVTVINYEDIINRNPEEAQRLMQEIRTNGEATYEIHNIRKDGTDLWCRATTSLYEHPFYGTLFVAVQQDITERKQAEKLLRESEERNRSIVTALVEGVTVQLADNRIITCNQSAEEILGLSQDQIMGRTSLDPRWQAIHEDGSPFPSEEYPSSLSLKTGQACRDVIMGIHKPDGALGWISINSQPIFKEKANSPYAVVTSFFDITSRKRLEENLRQSQELYRVLAHNLPNSSVLLFNHELRYLLAEGASLTNNGFIQEQIEGKTIWEVLSPSQIKKLLPYYRAALTGLENVFEDYYDDQVFLVHSVPIKDKTGQVFAGMLLAQDITALKQAERMLATEKERLAVTLCSIGDGVVTTDLEGKINLLNGVAEQLTGWNQAEALGRPLNEVFIFVSEKTGEVEVDLVQRTLATGKRFELRDATILVGRDGVEHQIAYSCALIHDSQNAVIGAVLVLRDISQQQRQIQEMLKTSKLEALGLLAGGIAHDFNNLLTSIIANLDLGSLNLKTGENVLETLELVEETQKAAGRAKELTSQLLTFAKGGAPVKKTAALTQIVSESASFALRGSNVEYQFNFDNALWPVEVDSGQISQVVQNLVINAAQAMPEGGKLEISLQNLELPGQTEAELKGITPGRYLKLSLKDEGIGISEELLPRIFDPYFTTKAEGNGLGLAVCYSIVRKHDGAVTVQSEPGQGTTFTIYLPAARDIPQNTRLLANVAANPVQAPAGRVLVMDDEEAIRNIVARILGRVGYSVTTARNGKEAIDLYQQARAEGKPFDVVILDLTIPGGMGGKQVIARLKELDPQVKAIASSGYSSDAVLGNYAEYGFKGILGKPYRLEELVGLVKELIDPKGNV